MLLAALALAGCAKTTPVTYIEDNSWRNRVHPRVDIYDIGATHVREFKLNDGTRCVSLSYDGGIDCDWQPKALSADEVGALVDALASPIN